MNHPFEAVIKLLNPANQELNQSILLALMENWCQLRFSVSWTPILPCQLWGRVLTANPTNFRQHSAVELAMLDRIAKVAVGVDGWFRDRVTFVSTAEWCSFYTGHSTTKSSNSVKVY